MVVNKKWSIEEELFLKNNYVKLSIEEISNHLNRTNTSIKCKVCKMGISKKGKNFNYNFFDNIDSEEKAYWLGFIWGDGYLGIRDRENRKEYNLKLSLNKKDYHHLEKFNNSLQGNYNVKFYKTTGFGKGDMECRLFITNLHMGKTLAEKYGMIPHRKICDSLLENIPYKYSKDFIRGLLDADGSFSHYQIIEKGYTVNKYMVQIGSNEPILKLIERIFIKENLINDYERKLIVRHKGRDGEYKTLQFSGKSSFLKVLGWLYKDSTIYLDRKYEKYLSIIGGDAICQQ